MNLTDIDNSIRSLETKELIYIYIMIVGGAFFLSYYFLFDSSKTKVVQLQKEKKKVLKEIRRHKDYLMFNDDFLISKKERAIQDLKEEIIELKEKKVFVNSQLMNLSNIVYSKTSWTKFLSRISTVANNTGVELISMKNQFLDSSMEFDKRLNVQLRINSNYVNTVTFIDKLEKSSLVVDIEMIDMELTEDGVMSDLNLSVWGIAKSIN